MWALALIAAAADGAQQLVFFSSSCDPPGAVAALCQLVAPHTSKLLLVPAASPLPLPKIVFGLDGGEGRLGDGYHD